MKQGMIFRDLGDSAYLLYRYPLEQLLGFYKRKYAQSDVGHIILSMTYFEDAEKQKINPRDLNGFTWSNIKEKIRKAVSDFVKSQK